MNESLKGLVSIASIFRWRIEKLYVLHLKMEAMETLKSI
jgi:hypothetical protein